MRLDATPGQQLSPLWPWNVKLRADQVVRRILPNDVRQIFAYDSAGRLSQIKYQKADATLIEQIDYGYDAAGRRTSKTLLNAGSAPETPMAATYDSANRMSAITLEPGSAQEKRYALSYDDNGALRVKQRGEPGRSRQDRVCLGRTEPPEPDQAGRRRPRHRGQLQLRSRRAAHQPQCAGARQHGGPGEHAVPVQRRASHRRGQGRAVGGQPGWRLGHGEAIARITSSDAGGAPEVKSYLTDALGSVIAQLRADQSVEAGYAYSPYGQTLKAGVESGSASSANATQYTGRENDGAQGGTNGGELYYYRARYYDPVLKRFISQDPIGLAGGENFYQYVGGNPQSYTDPTGLATFTLTGGGSAVVVGGGEGSFGIYISNKPNDIGFVASGGAGVGGNVGVSAQLGYVPGDLSNVSGATTNYNGSAAIGSGTWMTDPKTGNFAGVSVGLAGRLGVSVTKAQTETWGLRGLLDKLLDKLIPKTCP